jgi:prevent-host-death family protein
MSRTLSAAEAKTHLAEALRLAEAGEIIEITRYGKPVAALVGAESLDQFRRLRAAGPAAGLAGLIRQDADGEDFARAVEQVVEERSGIRSLPALGSPADG